MNPLFTVGTSRDPLGISAWRSIAHRITSSPVPVHSALVQKSVAAITNPAGQLSGWMLRESRADSQGGATQKVGNPFAHRPRMEKCMGICALRTHPAAWKQAHGDHWVSPPPEPPALHRLRPLAQERRHVQVLLLERRDHSAAHRVDRSRLDSLQPFRGLLHHHG